MGSPNLCGLLPSPTAPGSLLTPGPMSHMGSFGAGVASVGGLSGLVNVVGFSLGLVPDAFALPVLCMGTLDAPAVGVAKRFSCCEVISTVEA